MLIEHLLYVMQYASHWGDRENKAPPAIQKLTVS